MQYMKNISLLPLLIILLFGCSNSIARANEPRAERFAQEKPTMKFANLWMAIRSGLPMAKGKEKSVLLVLMRRNLEV